jgi:hypothetical protein
MIAGMRGTVRNASAAALSVTRLATVATPLKCSTAQPLHPQRDEDRGERGIGGQEDDRDRQQCARDGLVAQDLDAVDEVAGDAADRGRLLRALGARP